MTHEAELSTRISAIEGHLADCREHRATPYLSNLMQDWAGTRQIDFEYVAGILKYELEEFNDNLVRESRTQ